MMQTTHAAAGVEKGLRAAHAMPIEVMGLLHGHMSTEEPGTIVVTDVSAEACAVLLPAAQVTDAAEAPCGS